MKRSEMIQKIAATLPENANPSYADYLLSCLEGIWLEELTPQMKLGKIHTVCCIPFNAEAMRPRYCYQIEWDPENETK